MLDRAQAFRIASLFNTVEVSRMMLRENIDGPTFDPDLDARWNEALMRAVFALHDDFGITLPYYHCYQEV